MFQSGGFLVGLTVGFGAGYFTREIVPMTGQLMKKLSKESLKIGINLFEKTRSGLFQLAETMEDLVAEAQTELTHRETGLSAGHKGEGHKKKEKTHKAAKRKVETSRA